MNTTKTESSSIVADQITTKTTIRYYFDPLCGWCYGFSPVITKLQKEYGDKLDIEVISGGLFLGQRAGKVNAVAPHIKSGAYKSVETRTGVTFGKEFLDDVFGEGEMVLNSLPPTIALNIIREAKPDQELEFASLLLKAVYRDGIHPTDVEGIAKYAEQVGLQKEDFITKMSEAKYQEAAMKEYQAFDRSTLAAMPAVVLIKDGKEIGLSKGYVNYNELRDRLLKAL